jgi:pyroglutamyl-peptidase
MFGLAARTPFVRIETRARNTVTQIWPDADHTQVAAAPSPAMPMRAPLRTAHASAAAQLTV